MLLVAPNFKNIIERFVLWIVWKKSPADKAGFLYLKYYTIYNSV
jgi:hypothetical protein